MTTPEVAVVVPTFNRAERLRRLLPALEALAADGVEVVVVDDGSSDATGDVLASVGQVTAIRQPNAGAAAARNAGWRQTEAPIVVFLDDDCTPLPGWPRDLIGPFSDPSIGGVGGRIVGSGRSIIDTFVEVERLVDHGRDLGADGVDYLVTANAAYRRALLEQVGGFDEGFAGAAGEDVDLSWRIRAAGARLARAPATVEHDHRTGLRDVVRTYRGHGRSRARLDARFPDRSAAVGASRVLRPSTWIEHFRAYRRGGVGRVAALGLVVLRVVGLASFYVGLRDGRARLGAR
jgi:GT2 family glycosyltransferase